MLSLHKRSIQQLFLHYSIFREFTLLKVTHHRGLHSSLPPSTSFHLCLPSFHPPKLIIGSCSSGPYINWFGRIKWPWLPSKTEHPSGLPNPHHSPFHSHLLSHSIPVMVKHSPNMGVSTNPHSCRHAILPPPLFDAVLSVVCGVPLWQSNGQSYKPWQSTTIPRLGLSALSSQPPTAQCGVEKEKKSPSIKLQWEGQTMTPCSLGNEAWFSYTADFKFHSAQ